jgi:2-keto-4-pentenoate hydratase/2-oxohepta-3-ene-1,7-dioic acid hydratase in catechol pathway
MLTTDFTPRRILSLGLTYPDHAREAGLPFTGKPERFEKPLRTWLPGGGEVRLPGRAELLSAVAALDPGLAAEVERRCPQLSALMDYEVELGIAVLDDPQPGAPAHLGFFVANDLTARSLQILGEGRPDAMAFWGAAKGFAGFLPVGAELLVPDGGALPRVPLATRVNGELRQSSSTAELGLPLAELLAAAGGGTPLARGDVILTGTPAGIALSVSPWKRRLAALLPGRTTRLRLALGSYAQSPRILGAGDEVTVEAGPLGVCTVRLVSGTD